MSDRSALEGSIRSDSALSQLDANRLAFELAGLSDRQVVGVVTSAWAEYTTDHPHIKQLTDYVRPHGFNPLLRSPVPVMTDPALPSFGTIALDNQYLSQRVDEAAHRQMALTQLLTPAYRQGYNAPNTDLDQVDRVLEMVPHETFHSVLNPGYARIVARATQIEQQTRPDLFTVGDQVGRQAAVTNLQEITVRLAASEVMGLPITSLPDVLFASNYIPARSAMESTAQAKYSASDHTRPPGEFIWNEWYADPLREEVRLLCRTFIVARGQGVNPLDMGQAVNQVVLNYLTGNPGTRHTDYTYNSLVESALALQRVGTVTPSLPPYPI